MVKCDAAAVHSSPTAVDRRRLADGGLISVSHQVDLLLASSVPGTRSREGSAATGRDSLGGYRIWSALFIRSAHQVVVADCRRRRRAVAYLCGDARARATCLPVRLPVVPGASEAGASPREKEIAQVRRISRPLSINGDAHNGLAQVKRSQLRRTQIVRRRSD